MAAENSSGSKPSSFSSPSAADSYIGSLISLTSKSEIRYEGILYNINPEESSIGLQNVRSFGTEGRKKDGPQVPPSDKVYEYILFRGSDIKDLQVKASPPVQPTPPINNDPAIIQSHYPRPMSTSNSLPSAVSGPLTDLNSHNPQVGLHGSGFQGGMPLYQPGGNIGSWGASPPPPGANAGGLPMPMYWQGYYAPPPNGLPHLHQQSLLRPSPGLSVPTSLQQPMQYPNFNAPLPTGASSLQQGSNLPVAPSPLLPLNTSSSSIATSSLSPSTLPSSLPSNMPSSLPSNLPSSLPSTLPPAPSALLGSDMFPSSLPNKAPVAAPPTLSPITGLSPLSHSTTSSVELSAVLPPISSKPSLVSAPISLQQTTSPSTVSVLESISIRQEQLKPSLVTPGQLLQTGCTAAPPSQASQAADDKDVEVIKVSSSVAPEKSVPVTSEALPPILPLPVPSRTTQKPNGASFQSHNGYRGRGRGRGRGTGRSHPLTKFTEDFDFTAMNEKFNKDEVWGHLGKSNKGDGKSGDEDDSHDEDDADLPKIEIKPVYNKDDFFDSLSSNTIDRESQNGRPKFSEQRKLDTETFGDFSRYRGGRGYMRGGRSRGSYGYGGRGYGYGGRGYDNGGRGYDNGGRGYDYSGRGYDNGGRGYDYGGRGRGRGMSHHSS